MGKLTVGTIILINFPIADMKSFKRRPAIVVGMSSLDTVILCQITSRAIPNTPAVELQDTDFIQGSLPLVSYIRPDKLFTVDAEIASQRQLGTITKEKIEEAKKEIQTIFA